MQSDLWLVVVVCQTDPITDGARPSQHGQPKSSVAHQELNTKPYHLSFTLEAVLCPTGTNPPLHCESNLQLIFIKPSDTVVLALRIVSPVSIGCLGSLFLAEICSLSCFRNYVATPFGCVPCAGCVLQSLPPAPTVTDAIKIESSQRWLSQRPRGGPVKIFKQL